MIRKLRETWTELGKSIFEGERLTANLKAITSVSLLSVVLGILMITINIVQHRSIPIICTSALFILAGGISAIASGFFKARKVSEYCAIICCLTTFTFYAVTGSMNGFSVVWAMLMPIGVSYYLSAKAGIITSAYYELLLIVLFYTPLRNKMAENYSEIVMTRFPIVFLAVSSTTIVAMVNYHRLALREMEYTDRLNEEVKKQTAVAIERANRLELMSEEIVNTLAVAIDAKDRYTNGHSFRVAAYSLLLAKHLGMSEEEIVTLRREAMLHDIGKIGIPDAILNKPGRLTTAEFDVIKSHTTIGGKILGKSENMDGATDVATFHHERYDGTGYPTGRKGTDIPFHARIVAIADAYDAMKSDRDYRKGLAPEKIHSELVNGKGKQFDPDLLEVFLQIDTAELEQAASSIDMGMLREATLPQIIE